MINKIKLFIENHFNITAFLIFTIVVFLLYGKTLSFDWIYFDDDVLILDKQDYLSFSNIKNIFTDTVFGKEQDQFCRPILNLTFVVEKYLYGTKPLGYHLTNILLHLFCVYLIFLLLQKFYDRKLVLILCLLFLCHPSVVQAVAWIPGRNDSLLTFFVIISFYMLVNYIDKNNYLDLFIHLISFTLALLTKETAIISVFFYFIYAFYKRKLLRQQLFLYVLWLLIICLYFIYRNFVLSYQKEFFNINIFILVKSLILSLPATVKYIANIFFPLKLSIFSKVITIDYLLSVASILFFVLLFVKFKKYNIKIVFFGISWFILFLLPTFLMPKIYFMIIEYICL